MKIAIVTGPFLPLPPAPGGAVERIWQELAEEFADRGHAITVYCRAHPSQRRREVRNGVQYLRATSFRRSRSLWIDLAKDLVYSLWMLAQLQKADVIVTNVFWLPALLVYGPSRPGAIVMSVARLPKRHLPWFRHVDRLAAVSNAVRVRLVSLDANLGSRIRVIANPIDRRSFFPPASPRRLPTEPVVLYAGRIHQEKGIHVLICAFRALTERGMRARLRILGPFEIHLGGSGKSYYDSLRTMSGDLPVEFCAPVFEKASLRAAYHAADVFCYPSLADEGESFGMAPLEAMATGLVPVVSDLDCFKDFIVPGHNGIVFNHRAADAPLRLANSIESLLSDGALLEQLAANAVRTSEGFAVERIADSYLADFAALAKEKGEP